MSLTKDALREKIWQALTANKLARIPGAYGRIPNFVGAETAARLLAKLDVLQSADTVKCNPNSPQRHVRHAALKAGKVVCQAVPRLPKPKPFIELDPTKLEESALWSASSIRGVLKTTYQLTKREIRSLP
ncbi:MAG: hypothetical protein JSU72_12435 [Deltaproteobacteria bacterium]|nr:MAG: hypothetical protein JSU72_12435 [Deltaproteobacteria bacterium]